MTGCPFPASFRSMKAPVSKRALIRRINRVLAKEGKQLRVSRRVPGGELFITSDRTIVQRRVQLEKLAKQLGVLQNFETIET